MASAVYESLIRQALTSSIESYDKHLKTPQKRLNRPNGQQKPGKVSSFT